MNKALFLTFDNTLINTKSGRKIPLHSGDWVLNIEVLDAIKYFHSNGYKIIIIDNQEGVAGGYIHKDVFEGKVQNVIYTSERAMNLTTKPIQYIFWLGDRDEYYKLPNPGLVYECALEYELDLLNSTMIGSSDMDFNLFSNSPIKEYIDIDSVLKEDYRK